MHTIDSILKISEEIESKTIESKNLEVCKVLILQILFPDDQDASNSYHTDNDIEEAYKQLVLALIDPELAINNDVEKVRSSKDFRILGAAKELALNNFAKLSSAGDKYQSHWWLSYLLDDFWLDRRLPHEMLDIAIETKDLNKIKGALALMTIIGGRVTSSNINNAIRSGNAEIVKEIIAVPGEHPDSCEFDHINDSYKWIIDEAVRSNNLEIIKIIIAAGAKPKNVAAFLKDGGWRVEVDTLDLAVELGNAAIVQEIINAGAKPGYDCLSNAISAGNVDIVKAVIAAADKKPNYRALSKAISSGNVEIVKAIIAIGIKPVEFSGLREAVSSDNVEIVQAVAEVSVDNYDTFFYILEIAKGLRNIDKGGIYNITPNQAIITFLKKFIELKFPHRVIRPLTDPERILADTIVIPKAAEASATHVAAPAHTDTELPVADQPEYNKQNKRWWSIIPGKLIALAAVATPAVLYFLAPKVLLSIGSYALSLFAISAGVAATTIVSALLVATGVAVVTTTTVAIIRLVVIAKTSAVTSPKAAPAFPSVVPAVVAPTSTLAAATTPTAAPVVTSLSSDVTQPANEDSFRPDSCSSKIFAT